MDITALQSDENPGNLNLVCHVLYSIINPRSVAQLNKVIYCLLGLPDVFNYDKEALKFPGPF